jgi:type IV secretion system protein VirD4
MVIRGISMANGVANGGRIGPINELLKALPSHSVAVGNLHGILNLSAPETFSCVVSTLESKLAVFQMQQNIAAMLSRSDFDMGGIGFEKTAVFIITNDEKTTLNSLVSLFVKQLYQVLIDKAQRVGGALPVRVNYLLDEFAQLPTIEDMPSMMSAARSRNIRFTLYVQSLGSLSAKYGKDANTILGNCTNIAFLAGKEWELLQYISRLCGKDGYGRPLLSTSVLQRLSKEKGETLILRDRLYPYVAELPDIDDYPFERNAAAPMPQYSSDFDFRFDVEGFRDSVLRKPGGGGMAC